MVNPQVLFSGRVSVPDCASLRGRTVLTQAGTDVAREAAALVLLDDEFSSIVNAIRQGRRIYDNLKKATRFVLAVHVPIAWRDAGSPASGMALAAHAGSRCVS